MKIPLINANRKDLPLGPVSKATREMMLLLGRDLAAPIAKVFSDRGVSLAAIGPFKLNVFP